MSRKSSRRVKSAKQSKSKQSKSKQSKSKQSKAKQSKAKQSKAKQSKVRRNKGRKSVSKRKSKTSKVMKGGDLDTELAEALDDCKDKLATLKENEQKIKLENNNPDLTGDEKVLSKFYIYFKNFLELSISIINTFKIYNQTNIPVSVGVEFNEIYSITGSASASDTLTIREKLNQFHTNMENHIPHAAAPFYKDSAYYAIKRSVLLATFMKLYRKVHSAE